MAIGGNGAMDPADLHARLMVLQDDFQACRARSIDKEEKQMELLHAIQGEITRFETDIAEKLVDLKKEVHTIFEYLTKPKKKKRKARVPT
jgi:hypothetical protein